MIINIRGTSGSGKTHLARQFMERRGPAKPLMRDDGKRPLGYFLGEDWFIIGSYENACGGCDTISAVPEGFEGNTADYIEQLFRTMYRQRHIFYEGLIASKFGFQRWVEWAADPTLDFHVFFLDTPVELCLERVLARNDGRMPKGAEIGKGSLHGTYRGLLAQQTKADALGLSYHILHHEHALEELEEIVAEANILD